MKGLIEMKNCLFVVDVQNGFISNETKHVIPRIKKLLEQNLFDFVLFTKFINTEKSPYRNFLNWHELSTNEQQDFVEEIKPFIKHSMIKTVYTAVNSETLAFLKDNNIKKVYVLGIDTDCCVLKTAVDLFEADIQSIVLGYYSASNGGITSHNAALSVLERLIGKDNIITDPINQICNP